MRSNFGEKKHDISQHWKRLGPAQCSLRLQRKLLPTKWKYKESESRKKTKAEERGSRRGKKGKQLLSLNSEQQSVGAASGWFSRHQSPEITAGEGLYWWNKREGSRIRVKDQGSGLRFKESGARLGSNMDHGSKIEDQDWGQACFKWKKEAAVRIL